MSHGGKKREVSEARKSKIEKIRKQKEKVYYWGGSRGSNKLGGWGIRKIPRKSGG